MNRTPFEEKTLQWFNSYITLLRVWENRGLISHWVLNTFLEIEKIAISDYERYLSDYKDVTYKLANFVSMYAKSDPSIDINECPEHYRYLFTQKVHIVETISDEVSIVKRMVLD